MSMVASCGNINPVTMKIIEIRRKIEGLKWYQFSERKHLRKVLGIAEAMAWNIGIDEALKDLDEAGIIKLHRKT